jgi:TolB-like protein/DNA-binding winged helix-turn-helix (wHTH) protein/Tfp pilus assembly protein PilF
MAYTAWEKWIVGTSTTPSTRLYFGPFELDPCTGELWKSGRPVKLPPQPTKLLIFLASRPGELVTREEIEESLWGAGTFVDFEQGLNFCIKKIRSALGDNPDQPEFIQTLPRRGYRFIASVQSPTRDEGRKEETADKHVSVSPSRKPWHKLLPAFALIALVILAVSYAVHRHSRSVTQQHAQRIMLVVLPFQAMSDEPRQQYFSDGMTEELITQLGRMNPDRLGVIARASAGQYKRTPKSVQQIGKDLGVDYLIEGSARTDGTRVRITAQLIQVRDQTHLWDKEYDRELRDILVLQSDVARDAAKEISIELSARSHIQISPHVLNPVAYEAYLQGRYYWNQRNEEAERKALAYFQQAIAIDPDYAAAYAGIADCYAVLTIDAALVPDEVFRKATAAAQRALDLDDSLAEAHASLATLKMTYERDWGGAEREFRRALELNPNYALAHQWFAEYWMTNRNFDEALAEITNAQRLDPLSLMINTEVGWVYYFTHRQDRAIEQYRHVLVLDPNFTYAKFCLGLAYEQKGAYRDALPLLEGAVTEWQGDPGAMAALSHAYASSGDRGHAKQLLDRLVHPRDQRYVEPLFVADAYAGLNDKDHAFEWLNKYSTRPTTYVASLKIKADPRLDNLRSDKRYRELLQKMGLPQ